MTDEKKTFAGQGRAIRNLCEVVLALGHVLQPAELERAQQLAQALLDSVPRKRGNPAIDEAVKTSVRNRMAAAKSRQSEIGVVIRELRAGGVKTYAALAEGLNAKGIKPTRAEKWTAGLARALDPDRDQK